MTAVHTRITSAGNIDITDDTRTHERTPVTIPAYLVDPGHPQLGAVRTLAARMQAAATNRGHRIPLDLAEILAADALGFGDTTVVGEHIIPPAMADPDGPRFGAILDDARTRADADMWRKARTRGLGLSSRPEWTQSVLPSGARLIRCTARARSLV